MDRRRTLTLSALSGLVAGSFCLAAGRGGAGAMILVFLSGLPLFIAGLWLGFGAAALAGVAGLFVILATGHWREAVFFAISSAAPVIFFVHQALLARSGAAGKREWYPPGLLLAWLSGFGLAALAASLVLFGGPNGIEEALRRSLGPVLAPLPDLSQAQRTRILDLFAVIFPGTTAASWMAMTAINALLAQGVLARFDAGLRPSPDLAALSLPLWLPALFAAAALATALGATGRFFGVNVMIVLALPLCLAGLGVLHSFARAFPRPQLILTIFYVLAGILGWPLLFAALLGLLETPLSLRRRFARVRSQRGRIDG